MKVVGKGAGSGKSSSRGIEHESTSLLRGESSQQEVETNYVASRIVSAFASDCHSVERYMGRGNPPDTKRVIARGYSV